MIWTRVNPEAYDKDSSLHYEVSEDDKFKTIVVEGEIAERKEGEDKKDKSDFGESRDYTVIVNLDGDLLSNKYYHYRFICKNVKIKDEESEDVKREKEVYSKTGRCRTLPEKDADVSSLTLAIVTCNDYSSGYFNAFKHLSEEAVDFVLHVGDFAYEYPQYPPGYGEIHRKDIKLTNPMGSAEAGYRASSLEHFRQIYQKYRQDSALQAAMENHTWMIMFDDHEIADDAYWNYDKKCLGAHPDHPIYEYYGKDKEGEGTDEANTAMTKLGEDAMKAWREYVPARWTRITTDNSEKCADGSCKLNLNKVLNEKCADGSCKLNERYADRGEHYKYYKRLRYGKLVDLYLTDSRTYRDKAEGDKIDWIPFTEDCKNKLILDEVTDRKADDPNADVVALMATVRQEINGGVAPDWKWSMLGKIQKKWLITGITKSDATWRAWGNQTLLATAAAIEMRAHDDWHGFRAERYEILQRIKEAENERNKKAGLENPNKASHFVVFTGDMHTSLTAYLKTDFEEDFDPFEGEWKWNPYNLVKNAMNRNYNKLVGAEFMTPGLTSPGITEGLYATVREWAERKGGTLASLTSLSGISATVVRGLGAVGSGLRSLKNKAFGGDNKHDAKSVVGSLVKLMSPHLDHFDPDVNGYAIAKFTDKELTWEVYHVDKTIPYPEGVEEDLKLISVEKEPIKTVTYHPEGINLDD